MNVKELVEDHIAEMPSSADLLDTKQPAQNRMYFGRCVKIVAIPDDSTVRILVWTPEAAESSKEVTVRWDANNRFEPADIWVDYSASGLPRKEGAMGVLLIAAEFLVKNEFPFWGPKLPHGAALES